MEQIQAIMEAAAETNSPVIVQASRGARKYANDNYLRHLMIAASNCIPNYQSHAPGYGNSPATFLRQSIRAHGVMMEAR
jgi:fructose-bisphosphate aldolase class II